MKEQDLLRLRKEIDRAKSEVSELKGQQKHLLKQLKDEWGCKDTEEAQKKLKNLVQQEKDLQEQINEALQEIEEEFEV